MEPILEVKNLTKIIGKRTIIDNLSFSCRAGEVYGFLGPNGAGKTSTFKLALGLWNIDAGSIRICGHDVAGDFERAIACAGGIVEAPVFYDYLSGLENLRLCARAWGGVGEDRLLAAAEMVGLKNRIGDKVRRYSLGMKQRLGLAKALMHGPKLLLLDEPTNGLDPAGTREIRGIIRDLAHKNGVCVVLSSHLMNEMELICDRVGILNNGRLVEEKTVSALVGEPAAAPGRRAYRFEVAPIEKAREVLSRFAGGTVLSVSGESLEVQLTGDELVELNRRFIENGVFLQTVAPVEPKSLEDAFLEITGGDGQIG